VVVVEGGTTRRRFCCSLREREINDDSDNPQGALPPTLTPMESMGEAGRKSPKQKKEKKRGGY
jgi:hypothetical protein